jgi:hypothetical protein
MRRLKEDILPDFEYEEREDLSLIIPSAADVLSNHIFQPRSIEQTHAR